MACNEPFRTGAEPRAAESISLRAGPLTLVFEPSTVFVRRLCLGRVEIVRGMYGAVRDANWGTVPAVIKDLRVESRPSSFCLTFGVECRKGDIDFFWQGSLTGSDAGVVAMVFDGQARSSFLRNRIGLCVLHPLAGCAGRPCQIEHADATVERGFFPSDISPHQPFKGIRAVTHEPLTGVRCEVRLHGEVFEMEDQRNWSDASFKTYGTPLDRPFPVRIEKGTRVRQSVTVRLLEHPAAAAQGEADRAEIEVRVPAAATCHRPPVGLCLSQTGRLTQGLGLRRLQSLSLPHLRTDLHLGGKDWRPPLHHALDTVAALAGCRLHCALSVSDNAEAELEQLRLELADRGHPRRVSLGLWLVFAGNQGTLSEQRYRLARERLGSCDRQALFAGGTLAHFAELNRCRIQPHLGMLPCFSLTPQVHVRDDLSLVENIEAQPDMVASAWGFAGGDVVVSPITLRPRFNAVATTQDLVPGRDEQKDREDPRQRTLFCAGWTLASLAALSLAPHVHSLTYYETEGPLGIMEEDQVFPVYHVLADLAGYGRTAPTAVSAPLKIAAMTVFEPGKPTRVLLANLTAAEQTVHVVTFAGETSVRVMDAANVNAAMWEPERFCAGAGRRVQTLGGQLEVTLSAHAIARIDLVPSGPVD